VLAKGAGEQQDEEHDQQQRTDPDAGSAVRAAAVSHSTADGEDDDKDEQDEKQHGLTVPSPRLGETPFVVMPRHIAPMLATAGPLPKNEGAWAFEIKWDGVRALAYVEDGSLHLESRNLLDITGQYPELGVLPESLAAGRDVILDGEVVSFDDQGRPSFGRLQHRMHVADPVEVRRRMAEYPVAYLVFDVLWLDGRPRMSLPFTERRAALESLAIGTATAWQVSPSFPGQGTELLAASKQRGLEGVVAKKLDSAYEAGRRSRCWTKVKNVNRQEVVIGGWLEGSGNRAGRIGALLVGYWEGDQLRFAGKVGTGFTDDELARMAERLAPLERPTSPFADKVPWKAAHWVDPVLVADVEFTEWTGTGTLRHPSYKGLRADKASHEVVREPV
jgi:bifunctional non-homologous end joining protein LigD